MKKNALNIDNIDWKCNYVQGVNMMLNEKIVWPSVHLNFHV